MNTQFAVLHGPGLITTAAFAPDGTRIVTANDNGTARIWDTTTGAQLAVLSGHQHAVLSAAFSPDGTRVVTASEDGTARIWDVSRFEKGDGLTIACQRLGNDTDLARVRQRYGLGELAPICGDHPSLPLDWSKLE